MKKSGLAASFALAAAFILSGCVAQHAAVAPHPARIGIQMQNGVYAGISPDTHKPFYTTPADAPETYTWSEGTAYCSALDASGHKGWRVPTQGELNVEFNNRASIGGFNLSGSYNAGWYWSSSPSFGSNAWAQRFIDGYQGSSRRDSRFVPALCAGMSLG